MKMTYFAVAIALGGTVAAHAQTTSSPVPPGDGVTRLGNNPEAQACTPPEYNQGLSVYPPCAALSPPPAEIAEYPPCSDRNADRCVQTYTRSAARR